MNAASPRPVTREQIAADLTELGLTPGDTVMVHTSLAAVGWVVGGAQTVLEALRDAVGDEGTIVMPTQSWQLCDPAALQQMPERWWPVIRESLPLYDPAVTPSQAMGAVAELFRTQPGSMRSSHPQRSVAAAGPNAPRVVAQHPLEAPTGEDSPLGALYAFEARVLLLGVTAAKATMLHLAEHRASFAGKRTTGNGVAMFVDGRRQWVEFDELDVQDDDFEAVAAAFAEETGLMRTGTVGQATAHLLPARELVDYAAEWFSANR